ncbi:uncharacterized protein LOC132543839 [Ylistrum balloti]|uniref:uncharacterized protein LOC132543839 n=1 Tax=Ylistrum balloti TaxID=509963 RepID=UPI0029058DA9|nr:uncharacterized protein LOC132543839 [Ylistrum balloti]
MAVRNGMKTDTVDIREVFRHVSPYIIRQWKEVCIELGVQQYEIKQLETTDFTPCPSQLAFKGLCLWYDRVGKAANKECLGVALNKCGLRRAEEEIVNVESGKLDRPSSSRPKSSRPTSSGLQTNRTQYARRLKSANLVRRRQHQHTGGIARPNTRCKSARSGIHRARSAKRRDSYSDDKSCELSLNIKVSQISIEGEEDSNHTKRDLAEQFYDTILQKKEQFCWTLEAAIDLRDVRVETITRGSLCVKCSCLTLGALESLNQMFKSRRLSAVCQSVFVTESVRDLVGAKSLKLDVSIDTEELDASREVLLSRKFKECTLVHPADTLTTPTDYPSLDHIPVTTDVVVIDKNFDVVGWRIRLSADVEAVRHRYTGFNDSIDLFIRTLQIIMPKGKTSIESLADVIGLYGHLVGSSSLSSGVRTDLVREYLSTVNSIRILVDDIKAKSSQASSGNENDDDYQIMTCLISELQDMLLPNHVFEEDISVLDRRVNPVEKPFLGLLCFVPLLLAKLSTVLYTLSAPAISK